MRLHVFLKLVNFITALVVRSDGSIKRCFYWKLVLGDTLILMLDIVCNG